MEAKCIIFLNQKGGVAKTTSTYNIATAKAKEGKTVLMIDLDPQCSLTIAAGIPLVYNPALTPEKTRGSCCWICRL